MFSDRLRMIAVVPIVINMVNGSLTSRPEVAGLSRQACAPHRSGTRPLLYGSVHVDSDLHHPVHYRDHVGEPVGVDLVFLNSVLAQGHNAVLHVAVDPVLQDTFGRR